jgi:hypothetical protein
MQIDKGVPIPAPIRRGLSEIARRMEPGDSVMCETEANADTVRRVLSKYGVKGAKRKIDGGWRVWRLK